MVISLLLAIDCHIEKCNPPGLSLGKHFPAPQTSDRMSEFQHYIQGKLQKEKRMSLGVSNWRQVVLDGCSS